MILKYNAKIYIIIYFSNDIINAMAIIVKKQINQNTLLAVWEITESLEELNELNPSEKILHKNPKRAKEWLATRILVNSIFEKAKIIYDVTGKPKLDNGKNISISHSKHYCSIIVGDNNVAIDVEEISQKAINAASKFITRQNHIKLTTAVATLIWSAKECIFKLVNQKKINFKTDIIISPFDIKKSGNLHAVFKQKSYILQYEKINNHYLVYVCSKER